MEIVTKYFMSLILGFFIPYNSEVTQYEQTEVLYKAISYCKENKLQDALDELDNIFTSGYDSPADIFLYPELNKLRNEPNYRSKLRSLLGRYVKQSEITIIDHTEPGDKMTIQGYINKSDGSPVPGAVFYFFHTDHHGLYAPEHLRAGQGSNNPRLFGYVKTDSEGKFTVHTIRPSSYPGIRNLRHVHFNITAPGCQRGSQFYLDEDPEPTQTQIANAAARNFPIFHALKINENNYALKFEWICK